MAVSCVPIGATWCRWDPGRAENVFFFSAFLKILPVSWLLARRDSEQADDHVARMARFGLRCVAAASETAVDPEDQSRGFVKIRSGFHTGPVVGNVVGTKYR
jgi:hypothetical protein